MSNPSNNPLTQAFFIGRALAEALTEQATATVTTVMSEVGKFDAEQRDRLRQFTEDVLARAQRAQAESGQNQQSSPLQSPLRQTSNGSPTGQSGDLQALIDDLRAETAQLRAELQNYRNRT
jgi:polyhydroxyalkanoate synthesis regulator phasin